MSGDWQHGLFGCFDDITVCLLSYFVPCYIYGKTAETLGESCIMHAIVIFVPLLGLYCVANTRGRIREQKGIEGSFINDCLMVICCGICVLPQMYNEVNPPAGQSMARIRD
ncbi:uncharacterized protein [Dysidea avara]|uniref:uncharacterized protein n=1 Tax=Dysidea avara TaxID=196820 RepID=UPI0033223D98